MRFGSHRWWRRTKKETVTLDHYAPDIAITAKDYVLPVTTEERLREAEKKIKRFLAVTQPDPHNRPYFDTLADREEQVLLAQLREQLPDHRAANARISRKHAAELEKLSRAIVQMQSFIKKKEAEYEKLCQLYERVNGGKWG